MIKYIDFYKNFGVRRPDQLMKPPLPSVTRMQLPRQSLVHYLPTSPAEMGPNEDYFLFRKNSMPFRIDHVYWLESMLGNPRKLPESPELRIRDWRRDHQRFKPIADLAMALRTPDVIVVANYSVLPHNYVYPASLYREYFRANNFIVTLFKRMERYSGQNYNQFLEVRLPKVLPSVKLLDRAQNNPAPAIANLFSSFEMQFILQMWRWLGPNRSKFAESAMLSKVADEVNLIFREGDRFCCLNLGFLEKQRKATRVEMVAWEEAVKAAKDTGMAQLPPKPNDKGTDPVNIQKRFLRILMGMLDARNPDVDERLDGQVSESSDSSKSADGSDVGATPEVLEGGVGGLVVDEDDEAAVQQSQGSAADTVNISESTNIGLSSTSSSSVIDLDEEAQQRIELDLETLAEMALDTEQQSQLDALDDVVSESTLASPSVVGGGVEEELSPRDKKALEKDAISGMLPPDDVVGNFSRLLARASADGNLSANEYIALKNVSEKIRSIEIGDTTLDKYALVPPEALKIEVQSTIPDRDTIIDKSMLKSTLIDYRSNYVKNVMKRDIAAMAVNAMNAGYAVQDFQAVVVDDLGGKRTEYTVKYKPIEGQTIPLRFTIPDVDSEGVFRINNVAYTTRAQRGD